MSVFEEKMNAPFLSVIVATDGGASQMVRCMQSILDTCHDVGKVDILVVDNGSTDETAAALSELEGFVRSIRIAKSVWEIAWTEGLDHIQSEYVLLLTTDVILQTGWLKPTLMALTTDISRTSASPSVLVGDRLVNSRPPASGAGVCLLVRSAMLHTDQQNAVHVPEAMVTVVPHPPPSITDGSINFALPAADGRSRMQLPEILRTWELTPA